MSNFAAKKSGTGDPLHTQEPVTVASFRTWRGWRERVARDRCLTVSILTFAKNPQYDSTQRALPFLDEITNNRRHQCFQPSNNVPRRFFLPQPFTATLNSRFIYWYS